MPATEVILSGAANLTLFSQDMLMRMLKVFRELVKQDVYPRDWMVMRMITNK